MQDQDFDIIGQMDKAINDHHHDDGTIDDETAKRLAEAIPTFSDEDDEEKQETIQDARVVEDTPLSSEDKDRIRKSADRWVRAYNSLMKLVLPSMYKKKVLHPGDKEVISKYTRMKEANPDANLQDAITTDDKLYFALKRHERLHKYIEAIPLTAEEKQDLAEPLAEMMEKHRGMVMGPEMSLLLSAAIVTLPRLEPFFPNISSLLADED